MCEKEELERPFWLEGRWGSCIIIPSLNFQTPLFHILGRKPCPCWYFTILQHLSSLLVLLAQDDLKIAQGLWMILLQATSLLFYLNVSAIFQWCMTAENRFGLTRYSTAYHDHPEIWFCFKKHLPCFLSVKGATRLVWWECSTVKWKCYAFKCGCISGHRFSPPKN